MIYVDHTYCIIVLPQLYYAPLQTIVWTNVYSNTTYHLKKRKQKHYTSIHELRHTRTIPQ